VRKGTCVVIPTCAVSLAQSIIGHKCGNAPLPVLVLLCCHVEALNLMLLGRFRLKLTGCQHGSLHGCHPVGLAALSWFWVNLIRLSAPEPVLTVLNGHCLLSVCMLPAHSLSSRCTMCSHPHVGSQCYGCVR